MEAKKTQVLPRTMMDFSKITKGSGVKMSIRTKIILIVVISLLISTPVSTYISSFLEHLNLGAWLGVYINTIVSLIVTTTIITICVQFLIIKPIRSVAEAAEKVAQGDLTVTIDQRSKDEIGELTYSFNQMIANLKSLLSRVNPQQDRLPPPLRNFSQLQRLQRLQQTKLQLRSRIFIRVHRIPRNLLMRICKRFIKWIME